VGRIHALRQQPSIGGRIGLAAVSDDFFAATCGAAAQVRLYLCEVLPTGDLSIFADLGIDEMELAISGDLGLFPGEAFSIIARKLGFGMAGPPGPGQECGQGTRVARW
jgi:hypothetical protein